MIFPHHFKTALSLGLLGPQRPALCTCILNSSSFWSRSLPRPLSPRAVAVCWLPCPAEALGASVTQVSAGAPHGPGGFHVCPGNAAGGWLMYSEVQIGVCPGQQGSVVWPCWDPAGHKGQAQTVRRPPGCDGACLPAACGAGVVGGAEVGRPPLRRSSHSLLGHSRLL